jgi:hypothetical protein
MRTIVNEQACEMIIVNVNVTRKEDMINGGTHANMSMPCMLSAENTEEFTGTTKQNATPMCFI